MDSDIIASTAGNVGDTNIATAMLKTTDDHTISFPLYVSKVFCDLRCLIEVGAEEQCIQVNHSSDTANKVVEILNTRTITSFGEDVIAFVNQYEMWFEMMKDMKYQIDPNQPVISDLCTELDIIYYVNSISASARTYDECSDTNIPGRICKIPNLYMRYLQCLGNRDIHRALLGIDRHAACIITRYLNAPSYEWKTIFAYYEVDHSTWPMLEHLIVSDEDLPMVCKHYFRAGKIYPIPPDRKLNIPLDESFLIDLNIYDRFIPTKLNQAIMTLILDVYIAYEHLPLQINPHLIGLTNPVQLARLAEFMKGRYHLLYTEGDIEFVPHVHLFDGSVSMEVYKDIDISAFVRAIFTRSMTSWTNLFRSSIPDELCVIIYTATPVLEINVDEIGDGVIMDNDVVDRIEKYRVSFNFVNDHKKQLTQADLEGLAVYFDACVLIKLLSMERRVSWNPLSQYVL
jgi:hypothetical protein